MADEQAPSPESEQAPSPESLRLELQEAITTFRHQWSQLMQALGVTITADSALLSYGFAYKLAGVLLVASVMPLVALSAYTTTMTSLVPICYVAISLEQKLSLHEVPFVKTWVKPRGDLPAAIDKFANDLASLAEPKEQNSTKSEEQNSTKSEEQNSTSKVRARPFLKNLTGLRIIAVFVLQIGLVIISISVFHFRFL
jgi:hypothetical protein